MRQRIRSRRWQGDGGNWGGWGGLQLQPSRDSPHLVVLHNEVLLLRRLLKAKRLLRLKAKRLLRLLKAKRLRRRQRRRQLSECGAASSKRVGVTGGKGCGGLRSIAAGMNADITRAPSSVVAKARSVGCIATNCALSVFAFKAGWRVVVRILDKEQEADGARGRTFAPSINLLAKTLLFTGPWSVCVSAERVPRGGAHHDKRRPLPHSVTHNHFATESPFKSPDCRTAGGTTRCCGRPCSKCTASGSVCLPAWSA